MEFVLISKQKLKVKLKAEECKTYGIRVADGEYDNKMIRRVLSAVLDKAEEAVGFSLENERALVQLYPTEDGNAELFVTKLGSIAGRDRQILTEASNLATYSAESACFIFSSSSELYSALRALGSAEGSRIYKIESGAYLLRFEDGDELSPRQIDILLEFSTRVKLEPSVLEEYFTPVDAKQLNG